MAETLWFPLESNKDSDLVGFKSTIISSQLPVKVWYDIIGESTIADAIIDRLINGAFGIEIKLKKH